MSVYIVTDEDGDQQREYPDSNPGHLDSDQWALDAEDAAELWADEQWAHNDHPDEMVCLVTLPGTTEPKRYVVTVEHVPSFSARKEAE